MVGNSPSNGPFGHAFHYTLPSDNDTQHAINTRVLNEYSINNVNIREYFTLRVCTAYCIVGHSPLYIYYELLIVGIGKKLYGFGKISRFKNQPCNRLYLKNQLECIGKAVMMLYLG